MPEHVARQQLRRLLRQPQLAQHLVEAALCISWEDQQYVDVPAVLGQLDTLVAGVQQRLSRNSEAEQIVEQLNRYLLQEQGFHGNQLNYYDPLNSYLDQVLTKRTGLPILLALIYIEIGRRLDLPISGVPLPGHFLLRYGVNGKELYFDPFNQGKRWTHAHCMQQIASVYGQLRPELVEQSMQPPTAAAFLMRLLLNLKAAHLRAGDHVRALLAVERLLLIKPDQPLEIRDRGLLCAQVGRLSEALLALEQYADLMPRASDLSTIRKQAERVASALNRRN